MPSPHPQPIAPGEVQPGGEPRWHPNFRNRAGLPPRRGARTRHGYHALWIALAAALLLWTLGREYRGRALQRMTEEARAHLGRDRLAQAAARQLSQDFAREERKLAEARDFSLAPILPAECTLLLRQSLPQGVQLRSVELHYSEDPTPWCQLRGVAAGPKEQAEGTVAALVQTLRAHPRLAPVTASVSLPAISPDSTVGAGSFAIILKFKPGGQRP